MDEEASPRWSRNSVLAVAMTCPPAPADRSPARPTRSTLGSSPPCWSSSSWADRRERAIGSCRRREGDHRRQPIHGARDLGRVRDAMGHARHRLRDHGGRARARDRSLLARFDESRGEAMDARGRAAAGGVADLPCEGVRALGARSGSTTGPTAAVDPETRGGRYSRGGREPHLAVLTSRPASARCRRADQAGGRIDAPRSGRVRA